MVADGGLFALHSDAYWIDAGTPATYLRAQLDLIDGHRSSESGLNPSAEVDSSATVENSILGADVVIGNGAVIRNSVLMNNVTIGPGVHILDSIVADRVWVGPDSVIRELSVIGAGLQVAARSEFSSTRLPESD